MTPIGQQVTRAASIVVLTIGGVMLAGWAKPGTPALAGLPLSLAAISLWLHTVNARVTRILAMAGALVVTAFGGLVLGRHVLQFDTALYPSHHLALCSLLLGAALLLLNLETKDGNRPAQILALIALLVGGLALTGHIINYRIFYSIKAGTGMSILSAFGVIVLAAGVISARPGGLNAILASRDAAGVITRRLLPLPLALTFVFSWLGLEGGRAGWYGPALGIWLLQFSLIVTFTLLIWFNATLLHRADRERRLAEEALGAERNLLRTVIDQLPALIFAKDVEGHYRLVNRTLMHMQGATNTDAVLGKTDFDYFPAEQAAQFRADDEALMRSGQPLVDREEQVTGRDGRNAWVSTTKVPLRDTHGSVIGLVGICHDVTDRKRSQDEIAALNTALQRRAHELESVNKELEAFTYSVSHDLRAPLRHVDGFAQLLLKNTTTLDEKGKRFVHTIAAAAKSMGQLIDDLLAFSRMGRADLRKATVRLDDLVQDVIKDCSRDAADRNIQWQVGNLPEVQADVAMLRLVLTNLIGNAVKYTRPRDPAKIEITGHNGNNEMVCAIRDNGVGFDMQYVDKLFGVFQRLHDTSTFEGTGIGLANVRRIINRHRGRAWAEGAVDQGATFYFSLPKEAA
jgi:PAS domain S-box-containing protein